MSTNNYIDDEGFSPKPCPNCGGKVQLCDSRDCNVHAIYMSCQNCGGDYFHTESYAWEVPKDGILQSDWDIVAMKYFHWAGLPNIKGYRCTGEWG